MALFRAETRRGPEAFAAARRQLVLRGRIITLDPDNRVIADGFVCVQDDLIASISSAETGVPPAVQGAPVIETAGTIYPGLIELHNHPAYNAIPLWAVPTQYLNRGQWRNDALYKRKVANPAALLTHHPQEIYPKSVARFVECRARSGALPQLKALRFLPLEVRLLTIRAWFGLLNSSTGQTGLRRRTTSTTSIPLPSSSRRMVQ